MAIAQRGTAQSNGAVDADPLVINKPAGVVSGDVLIALQTQSSGILIVPGFTQLAAGTDGDGFPYIVSYKIAGASEPATYAFENSAISHSYGLLIAFSGCDPVSPIEGFTLSNYTGNASPSAASVTATRAGSKWLTIWQASDTASETITSGPAGATQEALSYASVAFNGQAHAIYSKAQGIGATGATSLTWGHSEFGYVASLILRPPGVNARLPGALRAALAGGSSTTPGNPFTPDRFMHVDASKPTFETRWGGGNTPVTNRTILTPQHKRVIIDGTTSTVGNYVHVANIAAAKALTFTAGDWWLFQGGSTIAGTLGELVDAGLAGFKGNSLSDMAVLGTFDPAHNTNSVADEAFYNTLTATIDMTGSGVNSQVMYCNRAVAMKFVSFQNLIFKATDNEPGCSIYFGGVANFSDFLFENCKFDHVFAFTTGAAWASGTMVSQTTANTLNNVTYKLCTFGYSNSYQGGRTGNLYFDMTRHARLERCLNYHGGWGDTMTRSTAPWNPGIDRAVSALTSVGTLATATVASTAAYSTGKWVNINGVTPSAYNGNYVVTVLNGTQFTYVFAGSGNVAGSGTMQYEDLQENGWSAAAGSGPDQYKHSIYVTENNDDVKIMDCVFGWDAANMKLTGGNYYAQNLVNIRDPIPFISDCVGNNAALWPAGSIYQFVNHLQVSSADINTANASYYRGWAANIYNAQAGSYYTGALVINQDNVQASNRQAVTFSANGSGIATTYCYMDRCNFANWTAQDQSLQTNTLKTYSNNTWDDAATPLAGSNLTWTQAGAVAKRTALLARNVYSTFATAQGVSVSQAGTNLDIELRVLDYMRDNWTSQDWCAALQTHFRSAVG